VQTLARLNRTHPGKDRTFVLDFQNKIEDVKEAFAPFFEATALEERTDLNQIYDLEQRILSSTYVHEEEVERFANQFFRGDLTTQDRLALEGTVRLAVERFALDEDEAQQEEFRQLLKSFQQYLNSRPKYKVLKKRRDLNNYFLFP
jgi:type I restriction enzyme R subunit